MRKCGKVQSWVLIWDRETGKTKSAFWEKQHEDVAVSSVGAEHRPPKAQPDVQTSS